MALAPLCVSQRFPVGKILHAGWREKATGPPNAFHHHHPKGPLLQPYFNTQNRAGTERFQGIEKDVYIKEKKVSYAWAEVNKKECIKVT